MSPVYTSIQSPASNQAKNGIKKIQLKKINSQPLSTENKAFKSILEKEDKPINVGEKMKN